MEVASHTAAAVAAATATVAAAGGHPFPEQSLREDRTGCLIHGFSVVKVPDPTRSIFKLTKDEQCAGDSQEQHPDSEQRQVGTRNEQQLDDQWIR